MKILAFGDERSAALYDGYTPEKFPEIDLVLGCGDLDRRYFSYVGGLFNAPIYYVLGNHDAKYVEDPPIGGEDIDRRIVRADGIRILGIQGSYWYSGQSLQYSETAMRLRLLRVYPKLWLSGGVDIILAHAPPDLCYDSKDPAHRGFRVFNDLIRRFRPRYFIHGHIHMRYLRKKKRVIKIGETYVVNASGYYVLDYEKGPPERDIRDSSKGVCNI